MFLGTHAPRLDEKGRLILPAKYRDELAGGVVITKGQERCLYVFPQEEFARITEALRTAPVTAKSVRDYSRVFFASAYDEIPDKQGRVTIPTALREYGGLNRELIVIGASSSLAASIAATSASMPTRNRPGQASSSARAWPARPRVASTSTAPSATRAGASRAVTRPASTGTCWALSTIPSWC